MFTIFPAARGCGSALNFDCSVVVLLMLRKVLSFLRTTWLLHCLPFDDTINIHKLIGYLCFVLGIIHTIGHVGNARKFILNWAASLLYCA